MDKTVGPVTWLDITEGDYLCGRVHVDQIRGGGGFPLTGGDICSSSNVVEQKSEWDSVIRVN